MWGFRCPNLALEALAALSSRCRVIYIRLAEFSSDEKSLAEIAETLQEVGQFFLSNGKVKIKNYQALRALGEGLKKYPDVPRLLRRLRGKRTPLKTRRKIAKEILPYFDEVANICDWRCRNDMAYGPPASITRKLLQAL